MSLLEDVSVFRFRCYNDCRGLSAIYSVLYSIQFLDLLIDLHHATDIIDVINRISLHFEGCLHPYNLGLFKR